MDKEENIYICIYIYIYTHTLCTLYIHTHRKKDVYMYTYTHIHTHIQRQDIHTHTEREICIYLGACKVASVTYDSLRLYRQQPARLLYPWDSPSKNTGVHCHTLLQSIFPTQESNSCLLHWQVCSLPLVPPEKSMYIYTY